MDQKELFKRIMEIQNDPNLTDEEKGKKRQELMAGKWAKPAAEASDEEAEKDGEQEQCSAQQHSPL